MRGIKTNPLVRRAVEVLARCSFSPTEISGLLNLPERTCYHLIRRAAQKQAARKAEEARLRLQREAEARRIRDEEEARKAREQDQPLCFREEKLAYDEDKGWKYTGTFAPNTRFRSG